MAPDTGKELIGRVFENRYKITGMVGHGGMSTVYRAIHTRLDKVVALKIMTSDVGHDLKQIRRFEQEAKASSKLQHPNIIRVLDHGHSPDGLLYIAMELLQGEPLGQTMKAAGTLEQPRACRIMRQVCHALHEAHNHGVIHRDLKPDNIFLTDMTGHRDFVKILDFGIAKVLGEGTQETLTQTGYICGTPLYISPEQSLGKTLDGRADIYAVGVMLYEMFTGRTPFTADTAIALVMKHIHDKPPVMRAINPNVRITPELEEYIYKLLAKNSEERPARAIEVARFLERMAAVPVPRTAGSGSERIPPPLPETTELTIGQVPRDATEVDFNLFEAAEEAGDTSAAAVEVDNQALTQALEAVEPQTLADVRKEGVDTNNLPLDKTAKAETEGKEEPEEKEEKAEASAEPSKRSPLWAIAAGIAVLAGALYLATSQGWLERDTSGVQSTSPKAKPVQSTAIAPKAVTASKSSNNIQTRAIVSTARRARRGAEIAATAAAPRKAIMPEPRFISIESDPAGAKVFIRGSQVPLGRTPYSFRIDGSTPETTLVVLKPGFAPEVWLFSPSMAPPPEQEQVKLVLRPLVGAEPKAYKRKKKRKWKKKYDWD